MKKSAKKVKHSRRTKAVAKLKRPLKARRVRPKLRKKVAKRRASKISKSSKPLPKKIVRIMGHGQFMVDTRTLKRMNDIDDSLVEMVASEKGDDAEFKKGLSELNQLTMRHGKPVEQGEIVRSDIILPSSDLPVDEAKKLFRGEGVIPEI
jgi:hypothetical protein